MAKTREDRPDPDTGDTLDTRRTLSELVRIYQSAEADIREAFARIHAAEERLTQAFSGTDWKSIHLPERVSYDRPNYAINRIERDVWGALIDLTGVQRMMSCKARTQLRQQLDRGEMPSITEENVFAMMKGFQDRLPEMLDEAVQEIFEWLHPRADYKTNQKFEVGKRVVRPHAVDPTWADHWHVQTHAASRLQAMENVFSALDGKGQISKSFNGLLVDAIKAAPKLRGDDGRRLPGVAETEYFRVKMFRNNNLHIEFKRLDLLQQFNAIVGRLQLKDGTS